jgi:leader peptidase (prepilin peptidase)/N-methyltransferase
MFSAFVFGIFGLIVGSFINVAVIRRIGGNVGGRSRCMSCGTHIRAYDLIPVISWLLLWGKCRACGSKISVQYPLVECTTGALFALTGAVPFLGLPSAVFFCGIAALLVAIAVYDIRHTIIPDGWVYLFDALALSAAVWSLYIGVADWTLLAAGPVAAAPLLLLWLISRGAWMGFGDVKLALGIGWLLGPFYGVAAVFFAFIIGALISVFVLLPMPYYKTLFRKRGIATLESEASGLTMKSEVPFGPFLVASFFFLWFMLSYQIPLPL